MESRAKSLGGSKPPTKLPRGFPCERPATDGAWAVCVPTGQTTNPKSRHYFDDEADLWRFCKRTDVVTSVCGLAFPVLASWSIGSTSERITVEACPRCLEILKERTG